MFKVKSPNLEQMIKVFFELSEPRLFRAIVIDWVKKYSVKRLIIDCSMFTYNEHALYGTNLTFKRAKSLPGNHA